MIRLAKYFSCAGLCLFFLAGCTSNVPAGAVKESITYELGDKVTLDPQTFITDPNIDLNDVEIVSDLSNKSKYDYSGFTREVKSKGSQYLDVGEYKVDVKLNGKTYPSKIIVEDTTPPSFISAPQSIVVAVGDTSFDPIKRFRVTDKSSFTVDIVGTYNLNVPGNYDVQIVAKDKYGNTDKISITMKVVDSQQTITQEDQMDEDFNDINEAASQQTPSQKPGKPQEETSQPADEGGTEVETQPEEETKACPVTGIDPGTPYYYSFDEAYAAGTQWNQQSPGNYFFYLIGKDDCGQTIYVVTFGKGSDSSADKETGETPEKPAPSNTIDADQGRSASETQEGTGSDHS